jgi:hypothetical protein
MALYRKHCSFGTVWLNADRLYAVDITFFVQSHHEIEFQIVCIPYILQFPYYLTTKFKFMSPLYGKRKRFHSL